MSTRAQKLLVIDDDATLRRTIIKGLRPMGFEIIDCDNGIEGLQLARAHSPILIISDINMERGDGYSVLAQLRQDPLLASIPLILMTGDTDDEDGMRRGMERGADDYLTKPFHIEALRAAVKARLARRQAETSTQRLLLKTLEVTTDLVCVARLNDHRIIHLNRAGRTLLGVEPGISGDRFSLDHFYSKTAWTLMQKTALPAAMANGVWAGDIHVINRAGTEIPASQVIIIHDDSAGRPEHLSLVARDLSERAHAEQSLAKSYAQMRELTARLVSAQEEERGRIAREIHDEFAQQLTGFNVDLSWLEKRIREASRSAPAHAQWLEKIASMQLEVKATIQTVRRIATELRPAILDKLGLIPALEWQAKEFQSRTGIKCVFQCALDDIEWDSDRSTALFRIFQETLTNVARHSRARCVRASLTRTATSVRLFVHDDGVGISDAGQLDRKSLGLLGMKERAFLVGGTFRISGKRSHGTKVEVELPLGQTPVKHD
jgi:signal transduction histidine kinase